MGSEFDCVNRGLSNLGSLLDGLKAKSFTRGNSSPHLPKIQSSSSSFTASPLPRSRHFPNRSSTNLTDPNHTPLGAGGSPFTLSPESSQSSFTSFTSRRPSRVHNPAYLTVRQLRPLLELFSAKTGEPVSGLTSHRLREYMILNKLFPPEDKATQQYFTSGFPTPDVVVTYTWSSPLELVCSALEAALTRIEFNSFTVWLDIFCLRQDNREMSKELLAAQSLYASAQRHLVATAPGNGLEVLTRAWCCFELAIRMKGLGFASPPQLIAATNRSAAHSLNHSIMSGISVTRQTCRLGHQSLGLTGGRSTSVEQEGEELSPPASPVAFLPPPSADPAELLARMLTGRLGAAAGTQPSFMSLMVATVPSDLDVIKAEVLRVFRTPECFDDLLLGFVEADEVAWLASHLPKMSAASRPPVRQQVVAWIVAAYRPQLPRVEPDLTVMAVLLDLEDKKLAHLIITKIQAMVPRGPSAFDWRHLHLPPDIKRAAAAEVRRSAKDVASAYDADPIASQLRARRSCRQVWKLFVSRALA